MATQKSSGSGGAPTRQGTARRRKNGRHKPAGADLALAIARTALDKKALNVEVIDVRGKVDYADYVVVMSGRSDRQVSSLAKSIEESLVEGYGVRCSSVEGLPQSSWVLMDFGDVIVHIFHEDMRGYYDLETLWMDAARVAVEG